MTEKPILFSAPMIRAILDGRKTQTRRVLKPQPEPPPMEGGKWHVRNRHGGCFCPERDIGTIAVPYCPIAEGDELWVREAFCYDVVERPPYDVNGNPTCKEIVRYRATDRDEGTAKWKPSIHMPRAASRITLRVTAVKVERLQDISDEDAFLEGVGAEMEYLDGMPIGYGSAIPNYRDLWNSINGPGSWDANPWVSAYSFEVVK